MPVIADPPITVTSVFSLSAFIEDALAKKPDVLEDNIWTRGYRSELGINTELLWTVPAAQYDEKLSIAIAANDLPDVIPTNAGSPFAGSRMVATHRRSCYRDLDISSAAATACPLTAMLSP